MKDNKRLFIILVTAILIKLFFFAFIATHLPKNKFEPDSVDYLGTAKTLYSQGAFLRTDNSGATQYETLRTPGYPVFLAILHYLINIPLDGIVFIQILLTIIVGLIVYKTANLIDSRLGILSAAIVLYDFPTLRFSLMLMTETLFLLLMATLLLSFTLYFKRGGLKYIIISALILAMATYVRPVSYYLGVAIVIFIVCAKIPGNFRKTLTHALIFLVIVYGLLGAWQIRNYRRSGTTAFATIASVNFQQFGLIKSYSANNYPHAQGASPVPYYANLTLRSFLYLMTRPGSLKYVKPYPAMAIPGTVLSYLLMVFWLIGLITGISKIKKNVYYRFMLFVILYFVSVTIINVGLISSERYRVPMVPYIAIIASYGWISLLTLIKKKDAVKPSI
jgi:hypothetical protein